MIKVKSLHPDSILKNFTISFQTTASVGTFYQLVPHDCILENVMNGIGIATTSNRTFNINNLSVSRIYLDSAAVNTSAAVGSSFKVGVGASADGGSGTIGRPFISAGSLLKFTWSASKGDSCFLANYKRVKPNFS